MNSPVSNMGRGSVQQVVSGASKSMASSQMLSQLFQQIDTNNTGSITKGQFQSSFQDLMMPSRLKSLGADTLFSKLDANGAGSVSKQEFVSGMKDALTQLRTQRGVSRNDAGGFGSGIGQGNDFGTILASSLKSLQSATDRQPSSVIKTPSNLNIYG